MIKAAIFDMDGLLIDSEPLWHRAHSKAFGKVGFEKVTEKHHLGMLGRRTKEAVEYMHGQQPWDGLSI